jgi:transcriptional regulator with XRE-family HTH domain
MQTQTSPAGKIGHVLRGLRTKNKLSQLEVSLRCGISARHYQAIEYGKKNCQVTTLTKILEVYDIDLFHLFSSFFVEEFQRDGVAGLYEVFGDKAFA